MGKIKNQILRNLFLLFAGAVTAFIGVMILTGCESKSAVKTDTINCKYPMGENQRLEYEFKFNKDKLNNMMVYIKTSLKDATEEAYKETKDATTDVVEKQNTFKGVDASYKADDTAKIISETIKIDMQQYDMKKDELELFGDKKYDEITPDFVKKKYKEDGFQIFVNGKEFLDN